MSSRRAAHQTAAALATALALSAFAASASLAADEPPPRPTKVTADFSYVSTAGNSEVQTLTGTEKLEHRTGKWLLTQDAAAVWGTDDGVENAGRYMAGLRGDYELSKRVSVYLLGLWRRNTFAGISRQFDEGTGLVYHAVIPNPHQLDLEAGAGLSQRRTTAGVQEDFGTGRLAALYRYYFREKAYFEGGGIYLANFKNSDDYEWDARAALVAPLSGLLALKLGYNYHHRNAPPPGFEKWDSTFNAGIQVTY
jgi:putative salt-induced outer membrane protein YdiY